MLRTYHLDPRDDARDMHEWEHAWDELSKYTDDDRAELNDDSGEVWQYMGSYRQQSFCGVKYWVHEFRHRDRPAGRPDIAGERCFDRVHVSVLASRCFHQEQGDLADRWHASQPKLWARMRAYGPARQA